MNVKDDCERCGGGGRVVGYRKVVTQCGVCWGTGKKPVPVTGKQRIIKVEGRLTRKERRHG